MGAEPMQRIAEQLQTLLNRPRRVPTDLRQSRSQRCLSDTDGVAMASDSAEIVFQNPPPLPAATDQVQPVD